MSLDPGCDHNSIRQPPGCQLGVSFLLQAAFSKLIIPESCCGGSYAFGAERLPMRALSKSVGSLGLRRVADILFPARLPLSPCLFLISSQSQEAEPIPRNALPTYYLFAGCAATPFPFWLSQQNQPLTPTFNKCLEEVRSSFFGPVVQSDDLVCVLSVNALTLQVHAARDPETDQAWYQIKPCSSSELGNHAPRYYTGVKDHPHPENERPSSMDQAACAGFGVWMITIGCQCFGPLRFFFEAPSVRDYISAMRRRYLPLLLLKLAQSASGPDSETISLEISATRASDEFSMHRDIVFEVGGSSVGHLQLEKLADLRPVDDESDLPSVRVEDRPDPEEYLTQCPFFMEQAAIRWRCAGLIFDRIAALESRIRKNSWDISAAVGYSVVYIPGVWVIHFFRRCDERRFFLWTSHGKVVEELYQVFALADQKGLIVISLRASRALNGSLVRQFGNFRHRCRPKRTVQSTKRRWARYYKENMDTLRTAPDRMDLHNSGLFYHHLHLCSSSIAPTTHANYCCGPLPPCLIAALACRPNCHHASDAYRNPYPTSVPRPPKAHKRARKRRRINNSSPQSSGAASTSNLKHTQTNVDSDRPAKRARTGSFPSEYGAASTHRAPQVGATNERAEFARVTGKHPSVDWRLITVFAWARRSSSTRACRLRATHQRASPPRDRFADGLHLAPVARFPPTSMPPRGTMLTKVNTFLSAFSKSNTPFSKSDTTCLGMPESRVTG
ncbi:hypothetical protein C8R45DRAFT_946890 [Mycena sanguinolenta]|nr:hypothetical protein C8R45DRAFT_946890 [Mycena sanguinolenta]